MMEMVGDRKKSGSGTALVGGTTLLGDEDGELVDLSLSTSQCTELLKVREKKERKERRG